MAKIMGTSRLLGIFFINNAKNRHWSSIQLKLFSEWIHTNLEWYSKRYSSYNSQYNFRVSSNQDFTINSCMVRSIDFLKNFFPYWADLIVQMVLGSKTKRNFSWEQSQRCNTHFMRGVSIVLSNAYVHTFVRDSKWSFLR